MRRCDRIAAHVVVGGHASSDVAVAVDIGAVVSATSVVNGRVVNEEAPRLIQLAELLAEGAISEEEALEAKLKVLGVAETPTFASDTFPGSAFETLASDAGQQMLDACSSPREVADRLAHFFEKQETDSSCGICSTGTAMLATGGTAVAGLPSPQMRDIFTLPPTLEVMPMQEVIDEGTTMDRASHAAVPHSPTRHGCLLRTPDPSACRGGGDPAEERRRQRVEAPRGRALRGHVPLNLQRRTRRWHGQRQVSSHYLGIIWGYL